MEDRLNFLLVSEWIQKVDRGEMTPKDLYNKIAGLQKEIRELKHTRILDTAEIKNLRRQIELLAWGDKDATTH